MITHPSAKKLAAETLASAIRPPAPMRVSDWISRNIVLVDGPRAGHLWAADGAPYLVEIADCLSEDHPCNLVTVRKSQQTGASILALAWALFVADREPGNMLYAVPGIDALKDLSSGKLQPLIDAFQKRARRKVIMPQTLRSGAGSTTYEKVFAKGGRLWLANANSVMDLSSKTAKKGVKDEISKWGDIPGYGDPETLYFGRFTAHRRTQDYKILEISTPEVDTGDELGEADGHCRIDRSFRRSDQRYWHFACPKCGTVQYHRFEQFRPNEQDPDASVYECEGCGHGITEPERVIMLRPESGAQWIATAPGVGRYFLRMGSSDRLFAIGYETPDRPKGLPPGGKALYDSSGKVLKFIPGEKMDFDAAGQDVVIRNAKSVSIVGSKEVVLGAGGRYVRIRPGRIDLAVTSPDAEAPFRVGTEGGPSNVIWGRVD